MTDILNRAEAIQQNAKSEWAVRSVQAAEALDLLPELITECEKWRKIAIEEHAARRYYESLPCADDQYSWHDYPEEPCHCKKKSEYRKQAEKELIYAPDKDQNFKMHIRCYGETLALTKEQRAALETVDALLWKHASEDGIQTVGKILYDLRTSSPPAWEATDMRRCALEVVADSVDCFPQLASNDAPIACRDVLRTMLEEVGK